jgi:hypothetical protein
MNVEIGAEAALFPEKEYISGIFVAVQSHSPTIHIRDGIFQLLRSPGIDFALPM